MIAAGAGLLLFAAGAFAQSAAEKAMETLLRDMDEMVVNERMGCYVECDTVDAGSNGFGFDEAWFMGTSGKQADDMPYEYFHYYVKAQTVTNAMGVPFVRFDLHKARMIMAVGDDWRRTINTYALAKGKANWWEKLGQLNSWDDQVLAENVVCFDFYCWGADGSAWMSGRGSYVEFDSRQVHYDGGRETVSNVPPAAIDANLWVTSPEAAMALAVGADSKQEKEARELMLREATTYSIRAEPITGPAQLSHPANHYLD